MIRQIYFFFFPYLARDGLIHKSSPLSRGFLTEEGHRGGLVVGLPLSPSSIPMEREKQRGPL